MIASLLGNWQASSYMRCIEEGRGMLTGTTFGTINGGDMDIEMVGDAEQVKEELSKAYTQAEVIAAQRYSDAEKMKFAKIIREFNKLYYDLGKQTWCNTRYRGVTAFKAPTDLWIYQELIEACRPDLIIETGSCRGGSALFLHDTAKNICPCTVISIDITHDNLHVKAKESDVVFLLGSSIDDEIIARVKAHIAAYYCQRVMVILDSDHSKEHVLKELEVYAPLVSVKCPLIVEDTNNCPGPKDAVEEWFSEHEQYGYRFRPDYMCEKFMLTFNRDGYFERVK
jgi:cephalosporin hydroxylase